jgi:hypothetical protein
VPASEQNVRFQPPIVGNLSAFLFLAVHIYAGGPSDPCLTQRLQTLTLLSAPRPSLSLRSLSSAGDVPGWEPIRWVFAKAANGITNRLGVPTAREVGYPSEAVALWAGPGKGGLLCPDLLHAIMDRLPVIGDWFCHLRAPPQAVSLCPRCPATGPCA